ncbi:extracellular solute-binding protein [Paenibacillus roseipurpureus]|uniref:Extracellular solute-binding protein n=1 Tax=Paenibacillus roseopurpureus TaxID=2918901 RepID=A0AA96LJ80_9BACL|nr:extracellular solute-binding protein [Paenibacillus sp. MBLB1832]WNR42857.1 extracellular solute-binding protein [Paenibacillus sp. MBLB1832]
MKKTSKLISSTIVSVLTTALLVSGCSSTKSESTPATKTGASSPSAKPVTVTLMTRESGDTPSAKFIAEAIKGFTALHPNVKIQDDSVADEASYNSKLKASIASGSTPDIFSFAGAVSLLNYAKSGTIMDITPLLEDKEWASNLLPGITSPFDLTAAGQKGIYSIPWSINYEPIYYNPALFEKAGITTPPVTWDDLLAAIGKLKAAGITPWALGGKDSWRVGHIHTSIFYKLAGVELAQKIGLRQAKWTDPAVVETFQKVLDLKNAGAFEENFEGVNYDSEKALFYTGKAAMTLDGTWRIGDIPKDLKVKAFPFPYFKEHPEFKDHGVNYLAQFVLNGKMKDDEKAMAIAFVKYLTSKNVQQSLLDKYSRLPAIKDADTSKLDDLTKSIIQSGGTIKTPGLDTFSYDPLSAIENASKDALMGTLLGKTPQEMTQQVQKIIDNAK